MTTRHTLRLWQAGAAGLAVLALAACSTGSDQAAQGGASASPSANASATTNSQVVTLLKQGITQAQGQQFDAAKTTFNNVLAVDPTNKYAHYNLGLIAQTQNDASGAVAAYDKAIAADAKFTPALYNKAIAVEATKPDDAIGIYENIVKINPKASTAYYRLYLAYAKKGDAQKANAAKAKAVELDPTLANQATATATPTK